MFHCCFITGRAYDCIGYPKSCFDSSENYIHTTATVATAVEPQLSHPNSRPTVMLSFRLRLFYVHNDFGLRLFAFESPISSLCGGYVWGYCVERPCVVTGRRKTSGSTVTSTWLTLFSRCNSGACAISSCLQFWVAKIHRCRHLDHVVFVFRYRARHNF